MASAVGPTPGTAVRSRASSARTPSSDHVVHDFDPAVQDADQAVDILEDVSLAGAVTTEFFGFAHVDLLPPSAHVVGQPHPGRIRRDGDGKVDAQAHYREDASVDLIGLGEDAKDAGELACLARIDPAVRDASGAKSGNELCGTSACGLEDQPASRRPACDPFVNGFRRVVDPAGKAVGQSMKVETGTGKVAPDNEF
nr:hypothetical protein [Hyphomonas sp. BRH_c22]